MIQIDSELWLELGPEYEGTFFGGRGLKGKADA
jgi:hypothetical protein